MLTWKSLLGCGALVALTACGEVENTSGVDWPAASDFDQSCTTDADCVSALFYTESDWRGCGCGNNDVINSKDVDKAEMANTQAWDKAGQAQAICVTCRYNELKTSCENNVCRAEVVRVCTGGGSNCMDPQ